MKKESKYIFRRVVSGVLIALVLSFIRGCDVNAAVISFPFTPTPDSVRFSDSTHTSLQNITTYTSMSTATHGTFKVYKQTSGNGSMYARMYFQNGQFDEVNSSDRIYKITSIFYSTYPINNVEYELSQRRYACTITNTYPHQWTTNGNANQTTQGTIYSIECENVVQTGSNGYFIFQFDKVNNINGYINLGVNNITFVWTNYKDNSDITNAIDNQTQQQNENQQVCKFIDKNSIITENSYLKSNGTLNTYTESAWGVSDYITFQKSSSNLKLIEPYTSVDAACFCEYDVNKNLLGCTQLASLNDNFSFNSKVNYIRVSILSSINKPQFEICTNGNQANADAVNNLNDTLNNSNVDNQDNFFNDFDEGSTGTLMDLISLPLDFVGSLNNSCQSITLPKLKMFSFELDLTIPCLSSYIYNQFGSTLINTIRLIINGLLIYRMLKWFIDFIQELKDPNNDDLEVMDL